MNRPGFTGELLFQMLGCIFIHVQGFIEVLLCFLRRDVSEVTDPELVRHACREVAIDLIVRTRLGRIRVGGDWLLTAHNTLYFHSFHQTFHCAAADIVIVPAQFMPDFTRAISLAAAVKGFFDLFFVYDVPSGTI